MSHLITNKDMDDLDIQLESLTFYKLLKVLFFKSTLSKVHIFQSYIHGGPRSYFFIQSANKLL